MLKTTKNNKNTIYYIDLLKKKNKSNAFKFFEKKIYIKYIKDDVKV